MINAFQVILPDNFAASHWLNNDVEEWLKSEIGSKNWNLTIGANITFVFKYEEDKVKFILRWL